MSTSSHSNQPPADDLALGVTSPARGSADNTVSGQGDDFDYGVTLRGLRDGFKAFGRYSLVRKLGQGWMGVVWLAKDEKLEFEVALKFLPDKLVHDEVSLDGLRWETRRCMKLSHQHIVRVYDLIHDPDTAAIAMEYVPGKSLSARRLEKDNQVLEAAEIMPWIRQVCEALNYAHETGKLVHRDLKPSNLMLDDLGQVKMVDFGIASIIGDSMSRSGAALPTYNFGGTLPYMSPQQLIGCPPSISDDVYALGATIYELLTSKPPFFQGSLEAQIQSITPPSMAERRKELAVTGQPIPLVWEQVVASCLEKEVASRPRSAMEVWERLQAPPQSQMPPGDCVNAPPRRAWEWWAAHRHALAKVAMGAMAAAGLGWAVFYFGYVPGTSPHQLRLEHLAKIAELEALQAEKLRIAEEERARIDAIARAQNAAVAAFAADLEAEQKKDTETPPDVEAWDARTGEWQSMIARHDVPGRPDIPPFNDVLSSAREGLAAATRRLGEERQLAGLKVAEMARQREHEAKETREVQALASKVEAEKSKDAATGGASSEWEARVKAWTDLLEVDSVNPESRPAAFIEQIKLGQQALATARQKLEDARAKEAAARMAKIREWENAFSKSLDDVKFYCQDPRKGATAKAARLQSVFNQLQSVPPGAESVAEPIRLELLSLLGEWQKRAASETPAAPLDRKALFAGSAYASSTDELQTVVLKKAQERLAQLPEAGGEKFYQGTPDGGTGKLTYDALVSFQRASELPVTAALDSITLDALGLGQLDMAALETEAKALKDKLAARVSVTPPKPRPPTTTGQRTQGANTTNPTVPPPRPAENVKKDPPKPGFRRDLSRPGG